MRRLVIYLFTIIFFLKSSLLFSYSSNPIDFINELVNDAISRLADKNFNKDQKASFIEEIALSNVDINALGLYTLGDQENQLIKMILKIIKKLLKNIF